MGVGVQKKWSVTKETFQNRKTKQLTGEEKQRNDYALITHTKVNIAGNFRTTATVDVTGTREGTSSIMGMGQGWLFALLGFRISDFQNSLLTRVW